MAIGLDSKQKALDLNLDPNIYGTFAEIGAGQEVARNFFRAGGAAGTIAKSMSAYDMIVSDSIYGKEKSGRYVCQERLEKMLKREHDQLLERLLEVRDKETRFFVFADTVAAKSFSGNRECHGWMGVRFQHKAKSEASEVVLHVKMLDVENLQQQEALGILGVNLLYACYRCLEHSEKFVEMLMDGLSRGRIEIDMIRVSGKGFSHFDNRLLCLELVKRKLCQAIMFDSDGSVIQASDALYKKNVIIHRGSLRPPTLVNMDMMQTGLDKFEEDLQEDEKKNILLLPEISMNKLVEREGNVDNEDFLARVDLLVALGRKVMISNFERYDSLGQYVANQCRKRVAFVLGVYNLQEILDPHKYESYSGGLLGGVGQLFGHQTKLYVYPAIDDQHPDELITIETMKIDQKLTFLMMYLLENDLLENISEFDRSVTHIWSRKVLKMIREGVEGWEKMVPPSVAQTVKKKCLFGAKCDV